MSEADALKRTTGMAFRLPPLSTLRVFEAAARHKSFRKAADELNLTASAVSHAVQTLENWLGVELFHRERRGLQLTSARETYAPLVNQALGVLARATEQLPGRKATGTLSVSSAPTFANKILLPRLEKFAVQFPDIRVTIDTSLRVVDLTLDDFDIAIRFASTKKPAPNWTLLAVETLLPVCSPSLKAQFGGSPAERSRTGALLACDMSARPSANISAPAQKTRIVPNRSAMMPAIGCRCPKADFVSPTRRRTRHGPIDCRPTSASGKSRATSAAHCT